MSEKPKRLRCAIYTRKSSEEGLDQAFNSLHAQREACEAYVKSQVGEGWSALKALYDDGGFSGGSMERPGLQRLLADIDAGQVDVVVVYKVDRLTRSLGDFARIVERFDRAGASFVSVTQAFNTTSSMGRLTLNVLLSFAQFEREVTGERIRDKIAASKRKGMWMGGGLPYGYDTPTDLQTRALVVNEVEATIVRRIFDRYLELGSVHKLAQELNEQGLRTKVTVSRRGTSRGGVPFNRGALFHLLKNRHYLGEIVHKSDCFPGAHPAIIDTETFDKVQALLLSHRLKRKLQPVRSVFALTGRIFNAQGGVMSPTSMRGRNKVLYRYYVSATLLRGRQADQDQIRRVPAEALESLICQVVEPLRKDLSKPITPADLKALVQRVEIQPHSLVLVLSRLQLHGGSASVDRQLERLRPSAPEGAGLEAMANAETLELTLPVRAKFWGGRTWLVGAERAPTSNRAKVDPVLTSGLRAAHVVLEENGLTPHGGIPTSAAKAPASAYHRKLCRLALIAPDLQTAMLEGRQPEEVYLDALLKGGMPLAWADQRGWLVGLANEGG